MLDDVDASELIPTLLQRIKSLHKENLEGDDVTVMLFRPNGLAPRVPMIQRVLAPLRIVRSAVVSLVTHQPAGLPEMSLPNIGGAMFSPFNKLWSKRNHS